MNTSQPAAAARHNERENKRKPSRWLRLAAGVVALLVLGLAALAYGDPGFVQSVDALWALCS